MSIVNVATAPFFIDFVDVNLSLLIFTGLHQTHTFYRYVVSLKMLFKVIFVPFLLQPASR